MEIVFEGIDPDQLDLESLSQGIARLAGQAPAPGSVTLVLTADFAESVDRRRGGFDGPEYERERLVGQATAITLGGEDDRCTVVIDGAVFLANLEQVAAESGNDDVQLPDAIRLLAHEGWHVAIRQRSEDTDDIRFRRALGDTYAGVLLASAGVAVGEYRVERAICEEGSGPIPSYVASLEDFGAALIAELRQVLVEPESIEGNAVLEVVTDACHQFVTMLAYAAAEFLSSEGARDLGPLAESDAWGKVVGPLWESLLEHLDPIPPASAPASRELLDEHVETVSSCIDRWLRHLGIYLSDVESGIEWRVPRRPDF